MVKRLFKLVLLLSIVVPLFSCSLTSNEMRALDSSFRSYERAIRWGNFTRAKSFHKNSPSLHDVERRRLKFYRVTGYKVLREETPNDKNAYLQVEIKYYKNERPVIKSVEVKQHWKRDEGTEIWYLDSSFPKFR